MMRLALNSLCFLPLLALAACGNFGAELAQGGGGIRPAIFTSGCDSIETSAVASAGATAGGSRRGSGWSEVELGKPVWQP